MPEVQIAVVASNAVTRSGIETLIAQGKSAVQVLASFDNLSSADRFMKQQRVDAVIIDDSLPRSLDIGRAIRKLLNQHPGLGVVMIASRPTGSLIRRVIDFGACGFLHRDDTTAAALIEAINMARKGGLYLSPRANNLLTMQRVLPAKITERDIDILQLTADGYEAKEISAQIGVGEKTVYRILDTLRKIYGAQNNANLICIAYQSKLLSTDSTAEQE